MIANKVKALPVVDEKQTYIGMVTIEGITKAYMKGIRDRDIYELEIPFENILHTLRGTSIGKKVEIIRLKDVRIQSLQEEEEINLGDDQVTITTPYHKKTIQRILVRCIPVAYILESEDEIVHVKEDVKKVEKKVRKTDVRCFTVDRKSVV